MPPPPKTLPDDVSLTPDVAPGGGNGTKPSNSTKAAAAGNGTAPASNGTAASTAATNGTSKGNATAGAAKEGKGGAADEQDADLAALGIPTEELGGLMSAADRDATSIVFAA